MSKLARILCVEDDPDIRAVLLVSLERLGGYILEVHASGESAVERGAAFAPDLILLDVMMPGIDGPTTLKHLRAMPSLAKVPVVFMTARVQPEQVVEYLQQGAVGVISKPFDAVTLPQQIEDLWMGCTT